MTFNEAETLVRTEFNKVSKSKKSTNIDITELLILNIAKLLNDRVDAERMRLFLGDQ